MKRESFNVRLRAARAVHELAERSIEFLGEPAAHDMEVAILRDLDPPYAAQLEHWYAQQELPEGWE